jgi:hypothetical protein
MGRMVMRPSEREIASQPESHGTDISFITRIRLIQRHIQVDKSAGSCIGHSLFERIWDPGVIVFHDKFRDLRPLARGKGFELLNDFSGAHVQQGYRTKLFAAKSMFSCLYVSPGTWTKSLRPQLITINSLQ